MRSRSAFISLRSTLGLPEGAVDCACAAVAKASATAATILNSLMCMGTSLGPSQESRDQRDQEKDNKHYEQDLGDLNRAGYDTGEAKNHRDDGDDEKDKRTTQHDGLLRDMMGKAGRGQTQSR